MNWKKIIKNETVGGLPQSGPLPPRKFIKLVKYILQQNRPNAVMVRFDENKDRRPNVLSAHPHGITPQDFINEINNHPEYKIQQTNRDTIWVEFKQ